MRFQQLRKQRKGLYIMGKLKEAQLSAEDDAYLAAKAKENERKEYPKLPTISGVNVKSGKFHSKEADTDTLDIVVLDYFTQFKRAGSKKDNFAPLGESVLSKFGPFYDTFGTVRCGYIPQSQQKDWTAAQKKENSERGSSYNVFFAINKATEELIQLSLKSGKGQVIQNVLKGLKLTPPNTASVVLRLVLDKEGMIGASVISEGESISQYIPHMKTVDSYVTGINGIFTYRYKKNGGIVEGESVDDITGDLEESEDEIDFNK